MMTLGIFLALSAATGTVLFFRPAKGAALGWMSEQWLNEHRAAQLS